MSASSELPSDIDPKYLILPDHRSPEQLSGWLQKVVRKPSPSFADRHLKMPRGVRVSKTIEAFRNMLDEFVIEGAPDEDIQDRLVRIQETQSISRRR